MQLTVDIVGKVDLARVLATEHRALGNLVDLRVLLLRLDAHRLVLVRRDLHRLRRGDRGDHGERDGGEERKAGGVEGHSDNLNEGWDKKKERVRERWAGLNRRGRREWGELSGARHGICTGARAGWAKARWVRI